MRKIVLFTAILCASISFAQQDITQEVGDFNEIKTYDLITVSLIHSDENKVVVKGDSPESVRIVDEDGILKVRMALDEPFDGNATTVIVYYKSISILDANEGSTINSKEAINATSLQIRSQEGGKINVAVSADKVDVKAVSGGSATLTGTVKSQDITINSGGIYDGEKLKTENTKVSVTAGGSADVYASSSCDARVTAGGTVKVYGNPKDLKRKKFAGGKITVVN